MNPYAICCINYIDGYICAAVLKAAKIKCTALHKMVI